MNKTVAFDSRVCFSQRNTPIGIYYPFEYISFSGYHNVPVKHQTISFYSKTYILLLYILKRFSKWLPRNSILMGHDYCACILLCPSQLQHCCNCVVDFYTDLDVVLKL